MKPSTQIDRRQEKKPDEDHPQDSFASLLISGTLRTGATGDPGTDQTEPKG
jgi:hypothetical protein